tara:strand:- start:177 stop:1004 length:828 start_codon:yes stop_codon:yes gene_type:complete
MMDFIKAHAYGNDFLFVEHDEGLDKQMRSGYLGNGDLSRLARSLCDRNRGVGADGLIFYRPKPSGASMKLFNADGSVAEVSGNGVRCLGAILASNKVSGSSFVIETDGGIKTLTLLESASPRYVFKANMGQPEGIEQGNLHVHDESVDVTMLSVGNPQCVVIVDKLDEKRFNYLGPLLSTHETFPNGTNVEFLQVESPSRLKILIWERGVGPTQASGTGACASAIVGITFAGASRSLEVVSPGGTQQVEWSTDEIYLTGAAEIICEGQWAGAPTD